MKNGKAILFCILASKFGDKICKQEDAGLENPRDAYVAVLLSSHLQCTSLQESFSDLAGIEIITEDSAGSFRLPLHDHFVAKLINLIILSASNHRSQSTVIIRTGT